MISNPRRQVKENSSKVRVIVNPRGQGQREILEGNGDCKSLREMDRRLRSETPSRPLGFSCLPGNSKVTANGRCAGSGKVIRSFCLIVFYAVPMTPKNRIEAISED